MVTQFTALLQALVFIVEHNQQAKRAKKIPI